MQIGLRGRRKLLTGLIGMAALICLSMLPLSAFSHADLVLQIESLNTQIIANPTNTELLMKRGDLHRRHEDYPAAARDFAAAREANPDNTLLDFYQGRLLFDQGEAVAAETLLEKYLGTHPEHAKAWALRGEINIRLQQAEPAAGYFSQAIQRTGTPSPSLYRSQILSLVSAGESQWDEASQVADMGLHHFGLEVSLLGLGIDVALANNQPLKAGQYIELLPQALRALPQWESRIKAADCITSTEPETSAPCLQQAKHHLAIEVTDFMAQ